MVSLGVDIILPFYVGIVFLITQIHKVRGLIACDVGKIRIITSTRRETLSLTTLRSDLVEDSDFESPSTKSAKSTTNKVSEHPCRFCAEKFASRNSLFRHLETCSQVPQQQQQEPSKARQQQRHSLGFRFSYWFGKKIKTNHLHEPEAQIAGRKIQNAFERIGMRRYTTAISSSQIEEGESTNTNNNFKFKILRSTQSSVANQRHRSLSQESGCAAANDIMTISFVSSGTSWLTEQDDLSILLDEMNVLLLEDSEERDGTTPQTHHNDVHIQILDVSYLNSTTFHAESSCTQYIYNYLLPLKWLQDGDKLEQWWLLSESEGLNTSTLKQKEDQENNNSSNGNGKHPGTFRSEAPSESLKLLRNALKSTESITVPNRRVRRKRRNNQLLHQDNGTNDNSSSSKGRKIERVGTRRMGTITNKERRAFHNFADPKLQGDASPNQEPVWRILDRCRIAEITKNPINSEVFAVLEFRGDAFLPQQIRRLVGTVIGITNGWLPPNTFDVALRPDVVISTVLAPAGRLYLKDSRFHFDESTEKFCSKDSSNKGDGRDASESIKWLQDRIFTQLATEETIDSDRKWIRDVEQNAAPTIRNQIRLLDECYQSDEECELLDPAPDEYFNVLTLLKTLSVTDWPETSLARSKVIKNADKAKEKDKMENTRGRNSFGSFTIVNPKLFQPSSTQPFPLGNKLFPDLVQCIFELEEYLCKQSLNFAGDRCRSTDFLEKTNDKMKNKTQRNPSTHCAVNFNASFTPHVDSGTGLGQSLSMIVGLGDYKGGEIFVEGDAYPIRYEPLEFDGWKQRHCTGVYTGERFSLVWFTPEPKNEKKLI